MKIAILSASPFPEGFASTNRIIYHAKGYKNYGVKVKIFITVPTEDVNNVVNKEVKGTYRGTPFEYTSKRTTRDPNIFKKRIYDVIGMIRAMKQIISERYDAVILTNSSFLQLMPYKFIFRLAKIKIIVEKTELPFLGRKNSGIYKKINELQELVLFKNLYGLLAISKALQDYYKRIVSKRCPVVLIPVMIDEKDIYRPDVPRTKNLVYTGPLLQKKDGILTILESFDSLADEFPETNLIMTGNLDSSSDKQEILEIINKSKHKDRMIFKGFVSRIEMVELLNSAAGLVLAKPTSTQSDTCFPTKLGEYLSSGNPIIVTNTGEIPLYLTDGVNAYIAEPDSIKLYTDKLKELLSDTKKAEIIGNNGRETAIEKFNYLEMSKKVINLINNREWKRE